MEYLNISQFAEAAGVTVQAVYRRLSTDLNPYFKEENGIKLLNIEALKLFKDKQPSKEQKRIQELESLIAQLNEEKYALIMEKGELAVKILELSEKHAKQVENFQLLLAQNQALQSSLIQLPSSVESVENRLIKLESSVEKKHWWQFGKRGK